MNQPKSTVNHNLLEGTSLLVHKCMCDNAHYLMCFTLLLLSENCSELIEQKGKSTKVRVIQYFNFENKGFKESVY